MNAMPLKVACARAAKIVTWLTPFCERIAVAGLEGAGSPVPLRSEEQFYAALNCQMIPPAEREGDRLSRYINH